MGAVHAACMADLGHEVVGIDVDADKIAGLAAGEPPFHEPGFDELLRRALSSGRLVFTAAMAEAARAQVYIELDPAEVGRRVARRQVIDGRNALDPSRWRAAGWTYRGLGRP